MKSKLKYFAVRTLYFFRLTDTENNLSITNIALIIVLFKLATVVQVSIGELSALLITLLGYNYKRHSIYANGPMSEITGISSALGADDIANKIKSIADAVKSNNKEETFELKGNLPD